MAILIIVGFSRASLCRLSPVIDFDFFADKANEAIGIVFRRNHGRSGCLLLQAEAGVSDITVIDKLIRVQNDRTPAGNEVLRGGATHGPR